MNKIKSFVTYLIDDERGQDVVEYALLSGFIAIAAAAVLPQIAPGISAIFYKMTSVVVAAAEGDPTRDAAATLK